MRGAVAVGIGKSKNSNIMRVKPCARSFGLLVAEQFRPGEHQEIDRVFD